MWAAFWRMSCVVDGLASKWAHAARGPGRCKAASGGAVGTNLVSPTGVILTPLGAAFTSFQIIRALITGLPA